MPLSSLESEVSILQQNGWGGTMSCNAKLIPSARKFYVITSLPPTFMTTSRRSTARSGKRKLTSSREDFPANLFPLPEEGKEQTTTDFSGQKCYESYERFNRHGLLLRMCVASLLKMTEWYSRECVLNWKIM